MATMYSLFLGVLFAALCRGNGDGSSVVTSIVQDFFIPSNTHPSFSMTRTYFFSAKKYAKNSSLKTFDTKEVHPSAIVKNFVGDKGGECKGLAYYTTPLQSGLMSPVKLLTIAEGSTTVQSKGSSDKAWTLGRYQVSRPSGMEDKRNLIIAIAFAELGVREATGNNDGARVEQYLRYTNLGPGYDWCAAFVSWCYGQAGLSVPRNPWSPALFPKVRCYKTEAGVQKADVFGIYSVKDKRINHVGLVKEKLGSYILTIEGNSNNRVESRRRHVRTIHRYARWVGAR